MQWDDYRPLTSALFLSLSICAFPGCVEQQLPQRTDRRAVLQTESAKPSVTTRLVAFDTSEGTFMNVDVSPDGTELVFDLLGDLYRLPIGGGTAVPLTTDRAWDTSPLFSPSGNFIYFISDRGGEKAVWQLPLDHGAFRQISAPNLEISGSLNWSQHKSRLIVGIEDPDNGGWDITPWSIDPDRNIATPLFGPLGPAFDYVKAEVLRPLINVYSAVQASDGTLYFDEGSFDASLGRMRVSLYELEEKTGTRKPILPTDSTHINYKPQLSHDGKSLAYFRHYQDRRTEIRILDLNTGRDGVILTLGSGDDPSYGASQDTRPHYAFTPDDRSLIFWYGGKILKIEILSGSSTIIPFKAQIVREVWKRATPPSQTINDVEKVRVIRWPSMSADARRAAFVAIGDIWMIDTVSARITQVTESTALEYMPAISPDGRFIAYTSFARSADGYTPGRLMVIDLSSGTANELLATSNDNYILPNWSEDGLRIAVIRETEGQNGVESHFGWVSADGGGFTKAADSPPSGSFLTAAIYARYVGFDKSGKHLLFSYPVSNTETRLAAASLDGSYRRTIAVGSTEIGGIAPAPDLSSLALTRRDATIWVIPFSPHAEQLQVSTTTPRARRVSETDGYYARWSNSNELTFGFSNSIFSYSLDADNAQTIPVDIPFFTETNPRKIAFKGARLITMSESEDLGSIIDSGTIILDGARILEVGRTESVHIPPDVVVIDAAGKTIVPGLIDTHYHRIGGGRGTQGLSALQLPNSDFSDRTAIGYGITTAWEPGGTWHDGAPATAELQLSGQIVGPRWSHSAMGSVGRPWEYLTSYTDALEAVRQHKALGVSVLKAANTPGRRQRQWLSAAAQEEGLAIISHTQSFEDLMTTLVDGYTGGEHSYIPMPLLNDVQQVLRQTGYIWTPSIVIAVGSNGGANEVSTYYWREVLESRPDELKKLSNLTSHSKWEKLKMLASAKLSTPIASHRVMRVAEQAASAAATGIAVGISGHNMPAVRLHEEMWYLWKGGLSAEEVLRAATIGNARKLGLQKEVGSLVPGKIADILVLEENPLEDMINTLSILYTVQGGIVYDSTSGCRKQLLH